MSIKHNIISFIIMIIVGMAFNPMNVLAYEFNHLYVSTTLFYGGLLMASNMIWSHEIIPYLSMGHFNTTMFIIGISLSLLITKFLLRNQFNVNDQQWLKRMIPHHSTALTTSEKLLENNNLRPETKNLSKEIIDGSRSFVSYDLSKVLEGTLEVYLEDQDEIRVFSLEEVEGDDNIFLFGFDPISLAKIIFLFLSIAYPASSLCSFLKV